MSAGRSIYDVGLERNEANYGALTPITFLERAAEAHPHRASLIYGSQKFTWSQTYARCKQLASALIRRGLQTNDTVAVVSPNIPAIYESHFGVPMAGGVLNTVNTRLDARSISRILTHGEAKVVMVEVTLARLVQQALKQVQEFDEHFKPPLVVLIDDPQDPLRPPHPPSFSHPNAPPPIEYEQLLKEGDPEFDPPPPTDEWNAISLNYTSGTTADPKGVVYHHRGAYVNTLTTIVMMELGAGTVMTWTLPMFHCNGWCFPWVIAALGGTNVCLKTVTAGGVYDSVHRHGVGLVCGAPVVLNMIANAGEGERRSFSQRVKVLTGGAPPPAPVIGKMEQAGFVVTHSYGLTETFGPAIVCEWKEEWDGMPLAERARLKARQGVRHLGLGRTKVCDPDTLMDVPRDGKTMGEIMVRGCTVMKGYLKNERATEEAFRGGYFRTGDLAVMHPDGYLEIKDRSKDIIISGGENISSIEVESVLYKHPMVMEAAVVARPDETWGESPCAFVALKEDVEEGSVSAEEIVDFCRGELARYMVPKTVVFGPLPKTGTGKMQKYVLRKRAAELGTLQARPTSRL